jgi:hypothetical protein
MRDCSKNLLNYESLCTIVEDSPNLLQLHRHILLLERPPPSQLHHPPKPSFKSAKKSVITRLLPTACPSWAQARSSTPTLAHCIGLSESDLRL